MALTAVLHASVTCLVAYDRKPYLNGNRKSQGVYTDGLQRLFSVTGSPFLPISCLGLSLLILYLGLQSLVTHARQIFCARTHEPIAVVRAKLCVSRESGLPNTQVSAAEDSVRLEGVVDYTGYGGVRCNPSTWATEAGGDEFEAGLGVIARSCHKLFIKAKMRADETNL